MISTRNLHAPAPRKTAPVAAGIVLAILGAGLAAACGTALAHEGDHAGHAHFSGAAGHATAREGYRGGGAIRADWHGGGAMHANWHGGGVIHADWHGAGMARRVDWHGGGGRWEHGWHGGHLGWWYIDAGVWSLYPYYYPYPYYAYPAPYPYAPALEAPLVSGNVPPPPQNWYYCDAANGYYPYVTACPGGWRAVPATPPPAAAPTPPAPSVR